MAASGAKYGIATAHFYWVGAIPAMVFVGIFMMPFYYGSKARSVPEYLKLRFDEKTRAFNAISFATMTVFSSGISMYALAKLLELLLGWDFNFSLWVSAIIVLAYIYLGGLTSAIYNEVLQFFLIVLGFAPLVYLGLRDVGGWAGLTAKLNTVATANGYAEGTWSQSWRHMSSPAANPMGVEWFGMVMGLGFVLSFGYWCTDFLVVQRAMAANSMSAARRTPLIAAVPKMLFPFLIIVPGMIAIGLTYANADFTLPKMADGSWDYTMVIPNMLAHYFPPGILGLGLTALMASFMSGMAGNVTAFNTVWTYDIYQSYIKKDATDAHLLWVGRMTTVFGILASVGTAYLATQLQQHHGLPAARVRLRERAAVRHVPAGHVLEAGHRPRRLLRPRSPAPWPPPPTTALTMPGGRAGGIKGGLRWLGMAPLHTYPSEMAQNFWTAIWAWTVCFVATIVISHLTKRTKTDEDLTGLVYSLTPRPKEEHLPWWKTPEGFGVVVLVLAVVLNVLFW